jgi:2-(1,2-epoxy-1,2-dihydrophenyl)acetyl-CoA isomerase
MTFECIILEAAEGVATLRFNRPDKLNALSKQMVQELHAAIRQVAADPEIRCLLLTGNGRAFCSGHDLATPQSTHPLSASGEYYSPALAELLYLNKPVVCAVNGACAGAGASIALSCDIVIAAQSAYFLEPFINVGFVPDTGASWLLPRLVGRARAAGMVYLAKRIPARQAADWGLIWDCVEDAKLPGEALAIARQLADSPPRTLGFIKTLLRETENNTYGEQTALEARLQVQAEASDDSREAVAAFIEKRKPRFTGR